MLRNIKTALVSVYYKDGLEPLIKYLYSQGVSFYSTGGTQAFIEGLGIEVQAVESLTSYPSILGGRVKTLHPKVFGGILYRSHEKQDLEELERFEIPKFDLVIVDLYPFEETLKSGADEQAIIEKIDIGGISLIRAAAKNFKETLIISEKSQYSELLQILEQKNGATEETDRKMFATKAFVVSSNYDTQIFHYFDQNEEQAVFRQSHNHAQTLRYGENPHQKGVFYGNLAEIFEQLHGKELSYNNLLDVESALALMAEFTETTFVIIKHTNPCGVASAVTLRQAYLNALACDPVSAFGGVLIANRTIDLETAKELDKLFFEILIAPDFEISALEILQGKKNRILLKQKQKDFGKKQYRSLLNGVLEQEKDWKTETVAELKTVTERQPTESDLRALVFAIKIAKHSKSNAIVLAKDGQLIANGVGQTSRVDSLRHAIEKAKTFGLELAGAVMASEAFFPFPDCVEIAHGEGIKIVVQPGGSIKDQLSIDYCNANQVGMVFSGIRHFKH